LTSVGAAAGLGDAQLDGRVIGTFDFASGLIDVGVVGLIEDAIDALPADGPPVDRHDERKIIVHATNIDRL
jgi:hypothetical protein